MNELPEIETIRRVLNEQIGGLEIVGSKINSRGSVDMSCRDSIVESICGAIINKIDRRGKYLIFDTTSGSMVIRLSPTGRLYVTDLNYKVRKRNIMTFELEGGKLLHFFDERMGSTVFFTPTWLEDTVSGIKRFGIEPLSNDFTAEYLREHWKDKNYSVVEALTDQDVVAGIGAFYSDEILFTCGIHPKKMCSELTDDNYAVLVQNIQDIMAWGIDENRMTAKEYDNVKGERFKSHENPYVHGRGDKRCMFCKSAIKAMHVDNRMCFYCPTCQSKVSKVGEEVNPDMFAVVASYVGSVIQTGGIFDMGLVPVLGFKPKANSMTWEYFIKKSYEFLTREEPIRIDDDVDYSIRGIKMSYVSRVNKNSFQVGVNWIKDQNWKEL